MAESILGKREQGTGNREKGTGNREQGTGNRQESPSPNLPIPPTLPTLPIFRLPITLDLLQKYFSNSVLDAVAHGGNHGSRSWGGPRQLLMGETTAVAHGGNHGSRSWGKPRQSLMGETTAVAHGGDPQDRAASPRPRCIALCQFLSTVPCSLFPVPDFCKKSLRK
ncbi:hypothetical protein BJP36_40115 [Moorena producens JHB]|uniref:Uncharacterized protein n=1 Tax=Moorena producens (strain JHB) TaxID=1454205 RepID=A0A9Q9UV92_MOOP1|nr:hypothetical protein [Moorena producens]WAN68583.1 hypothetical protein BJP36_40115 [Moorena producens JHB]